MNAPTPAPTPALADPSVAASAADLAPASAAASAPDSGPTPDGALPLRRNREYLAWLSGDLALGIGAGVGGFAFPLVAFAVTGSAAATGVVGLVQGVGLLAGMLPGGVLADRFDRRRLRLLAGMLGALAQLVLVAVLLAGWADVTVLAVIAGLDRFRGALLGTASGAMLKQLVTPEQLPAAVSVDEGRTAAVQLGAGPLGGALLGVGLAVPALVQAVGSLVGVVCTLFMRGNYRALPEHGPRLGALASLREGISWLLGQRLRVQIAACATLVNLAVNGALLTITLMLAADGVPAARIGLLMTTLAAAVLVGAFLAPGLVAAVPTGVLVIVEFCVLALAVAAMPLMPSLWGIGALAALIGVGIPAINAAVMGYFMNITPDAMQGRAQTMTGLISLGLMPLAPAIAGFGLETLGRSTTLGIFAALCAAGALVGLLSRSLRQVPSSGRWEEHARAAGWVTAAAEGTPGAAAAS
ncbi:MFS transporter [Brachybacterium sp. UNK5269]|uniref:MFS transporter n=1 Tax=Brachybacterium sp. UNK5269 TaxID=3408576 RepID=UPI003BB0C848